MTYTCKKCGEGNLLSDEMKWSPLPSWCKNCFKKYQKEYKETHKVSIRQHRNKNFKYKYGITIEEYEQILEQQNYCCKVCSREFNDKVKPDVDHNHQTKIVRGILCHACNLAIGYLQDDVAVVQKLLDYLEESSAQTPGEENVATVQ